MLPADAKMARDGVAPAVHQIPILPKVKVFILILLWLNVLIYTEFVFFNIKITRP